MQIRINIRYTLLIIIDGYRLTNCGVANIINYIYFMIKKITIAFYNYTSEELANSITTLT